MASLKDVLSMVATGMRTVRQTTAEEYRDAYDGDQEKWLTKNPAEAVEDWQSRPHVWLNITRPVVDVLSGLYREEPRRSFAEDLRAIAARMGQAYDANPMGPLMIQADAMTRLLGVSAIEPVYDHERREVRYVLYTADTLEVWTEDENPTTAETVAITGFRSGRKWAHVWTADTFVSLAQPEGSEPGQPLVVERMVDNPYGMIPLAFFFNELPHDEFWVAPQGHNIVPQNWHVNKMLTELAHAVMMQSWGQWWIRNPDPHWRPIVGPGRWVKIAGEGEIGVLSPQVLIDQVWDSYIERVIGWVLATNGVPEAAVRLSQSSTRSGISILAEQLPLVEERRRRATLFRRWEEDLAVKTLRVLEVEEHLSVPARSSELGFKVDYAELGLWQLAQDRTREWQWMLDHGLVGVTDIYRTLNPGLTREQAEAELRRIAAENELRPTGKGPKVGDRVQESKEATPAAEMESQVGVKGF